MTYFEKEVRARHQAGHTLMSIADALRCDVSEVEALVCPSPTLMYLGACGDGRMRVWRENWMDDQFEVMSLVDFKALEKMCKTFQIRMVRNDD